MKKFGLRGWRGWQKDMVDGCQVGRLVNEWMKDVGWKGGNCGRYVGERLNFGIQGPKMDEGDDGFGMVDLGI